MNKTHPHPPFPQLHTRHTMFRERGDRKSRRLLTATALPSSSSSSPLNSLQFLPLWIEFPMWSNTVWKGEERKVLQGIRVCSLDADNCWWGTLEAISTRHNYCEGRPFYGQLSSQIRGNKSRIVDDFSKHIRRVRRAGCDSIPEKQNPTGICGRNHPEGGKEPQRIKSQTIKRARKSDIFSTFGHFSLRHFFNFRTFLFATFFQLSDISRLSDVPSFHGTESRGKMKRLSGARGKFDNWS